MDPEDLVDERSYYDTEAIRQRNLLPSQLGTAASKATMVTAMAVSI